MEWAGDWYPECIICKEIHNNSYRLIKKNKNGPKIRQFAEKERQSVINHNKMPTMLGMQESEIKPMRDMVSPFSFQTSKYLLISRGSILWYNYFGGLIHSINSK